MGGWAGGWVVGFVSGLVGRMGGWLGRWAGGWVGFFLPNLTFQHHLAQDKYGLLFTKMNIL